MSKPIVFSIISFRRGVPTRENDASRTSLVFASKDGYHIEKIGDGIRVQYAAELAFWYPWGDVDYAVEAGEQEVDVIPPPPPMPSGVAAAIGNPPPTAARSPQGKRK